MTTKKGTTILLSTVLFLSLLGTSAISADSIDVNNKSLDDLKNLIPDNISSLQTIDLNKQIADLQYQSLSDQLAVLTSQEALTTTTYQLDSLKRQEASIQSSMDPLTLNGTLYTQTRNNQKEIEKYYLQIDYYKTYLQIEQNSLLLDELDSLNKQISVEETKLALGLSTQLNVDDLNNQKDDASNQVDASTNNIELTKNNMKIRMNMGIDDSFNPSFAIPAVTSATVDYSLSGLISNCLSKNIDVLSADNNILAQNTYLTSLGKITGSTDEISLANANLSKMKIDQSTLKLSLTQYIKQQYANYTYLVAEVPILIDKKTILDKKLQIIENNFRNGSVSALDYNLQKLDIAKQYYSIDSSMVDYLNSKLLINLIDQGICPQ